MSALEIIDSRTLKIIKPDAEATVSLGSIDAVVFYREDAIRFLIKGYQLTVPVLLLSEEDKELLRSRFKVRI